MPKYLCKNCGYAGEKFIFQFNDFSYCLATNDEEPDYIAEAPAWVRRKGLGEAEIAAPVACPKCRAWGEVVASSQQASSQ